MKRNKQHRGLPGNWRIKHGSYRYRVPKGMEHLWDGKGEFILGRTYSQALTVYAGRIASLDGAIRSFSHLIDRYSLEVTTTKAPATQKEEVRHLKRIREMIGDNDV